MSEGKSPAEVGIVARDCRSRRSRDRRLQAHPAAKSKGGTMSESSAVLAPRHVCIIADGNESWAPVIENPELCHRTLRRLFDAVDCLMDRGSEYVTISIFSKIDWHCAHEHLDRLMGTVTDAIGELAEKSKDRGYRIKRIGTLERLPQRHSHIAKAFAAAEAETASASRGTLVVPFDYSGREEICRAFARMDAAGITADTADVAGIREHLDDKDIPDPDIVVRLGGGLSLSDVYAFQSEYSALYFLEHVAPANLTVDVIDAILKDHAGGYYYSQGRPSDLVARAS